MEEQKNNKPTENNIVSDDSDMEIDEQELIAMECPTDSEEPLEVSMDCDLKI